MPTQDFLDHRDTLPAVSCLWDGRVRKVYVLGGGGDRPLIGNTDGYDDWAHMLTPQEGVLGDEKYNYVKGGRY